MHDDFESTVDLMALDAFCSNMVRDKRELSFSKVRNGLNDFALMRDRIAEIDNSMLHNETTTQACTYLLARYKKVTGETLPDDAIERMQDGIGDFTDNLVKRMDAEMFPGMDMASMSYEDVCDLYRRNDLSLPKSVIEREPKAKSAPKLFGIDITKDSAHVQEQPVRQLEKTYEDVKSVQQSRKPANKHTVMPSFDNHESDFGMGE